MSEDIQQPAEAAATTTEDDDTTTRSKGTVWYACRRRSGGSGLKGSAIFERLEDVNDFCQKGSAVPCYYRVCDSLEDAASFLKGKQWSEGSKKRSLADVGARDTPPAAKKFKTSSEEQKSSNMRRWEWKLLQKMKTTWINSYEDMIKLLQAYKEQYGNAKVPLSIGGIDKKYAPLVAWAPDTNFMLDEYKKNPDSTFLTKEQADCLQNIGFALRKPRNRAREQHLEQAWDDMLQKLQLYKDQFGDCDLRRCSRGADVVPTTDVNELQEWARKVRGEWKRFEENKSSLLTEERINILLGMGFDKNLPRGKPARKETETELHFETQLEAWKDIVAMNMPIKGHGTLESWVFMQRRQYKRLKNGQPSTLTQKRVVRLVDAGFNFVAKTMKSWDERATEWLEYKAKHGKDPPRYSDDGLGRWCLEQRTKYREKQAGKKVKLSDEQIAKLTGYGFRWERLIKAPKHQHVRRSWDESYAALIKYSEENGHCIVPQQYPHLGSWVHAQRNEYNKFLQGNKAAMTRDKIAKLNEIGFEFKPQRGAKRSANVATADNTQNIMPHRYEDQPRIDDDVDEPGAQALMNLNLQPTAIGMPQQQNYQPHQPFPLQDPPVVTTNQQAALSPWDRYHNERSLN